MYQYFILVIVILTDIIVFLFSKHKLYQVATGFLLLIIIVLLHLNQIPKRIHFKLGILIFLAIIIVLQIMLEAAYCEEWLHYYKFPYHVIIEMIGLAAFILLSHILLALEKS